MSTQKTTKIEYHKQVRVLHNPTLPQVALDLDIPVMWSKTIATPTMTVDTMKWSSFVMRVVNPLVANVKTDAYLAMPKDKQAPYKSVNPYIFGTPREGFEKYPQKGETPISDAALINFAYRNKNNIYKRYTVTLDLDDLTTSEYTALKIALINAPMHLVMYTSINHRRVDHQLVYSNLTDADEKVAYEQKYAKYLDKSKEVDGYQNKCRVVIPLNKPAMSPAEYEMAVREVSRMLQITAIDPVSYVYAQAMYSPVILLDQESLHDDGKHINYGTIINTSDVLLDKSWLLHTYAVQNGALLDNPKTWYYTANELLDEDAIELRVKAHQPRTQKKGASQKKGKLGAILTAVDIKDVLEVHIDEYSAQGDRWLYTNSSSSLAAGIVYEGDEQTFYSHHGSDAYAGKNLNTFDLVRWYICDAINDDESQPMSQRESYKQAMEWFDVHYGDKINEVYELQTNSTNTAYLTSKGINKWSYDTPIAIDTDKLISNDMRANNAMATLYYTTLPQQYAQYGIIPRQDASFYDIAQVKPYLKIDTPDKGKDIIQTDRYNLGILVDSIPSLRGRFYTDVMTNNVMFVAPTPFAFVGALDEDGQEGDAIVVNDAFINSLTQWLYGIVALYPDAKFNLTSKAVEEVVLALAQNRKKHPIRDFLQNCYGKWDGTPRVETLLIDYAGATDDVLTREATKRMLIAAARRQLEHEFVKYDTMLILQGIQNRGKSEIFARLTADSRYFGESIDLSDDKKYGESTSGKWINEMAELDQFKRTSSERMKAVITAKSLTYRGAYERTARSYKVRHILVATTNETTYLKDSTGNRRYDIITCYDDVKKSVREHFDANEVVQVWSEVMHIIYNDKDTETWVSPDNPNHDEYTRIANERRKNAMHIDKNGEDVEEIISHYAYMYPELIRAGYNDVYYPQYVCPKMMYEAIYSEKYVGNKISQKLTDGIKDAIERTGLYRKTGKVKQRIKGYADGATQSHVYELIDKTKVLPVTHYPLPSQKMDVSQRVSPKQEAETLLARNLMALPAVAGWEDEALRQGVTQARIDYIKREEVNPFVTN